MRVGFERHDLDGEHAFDSGRLPEHLGLDAGRFESLWSLHPDEYHVITLDGRPVETPRWQQAYGCDCFSTGRVNPAVPVPPLLGPLHDHGEDLVRGTPLVTISFGEERVFRLSSSESR